MLKNAYNAGVTAAYQRYKIALPLSGSSLGADYGVAPTGPEQSHGTERNPYRFTARSPGVLQNVDSAWNLSDYNKQAPGYSGAWGSETIG